MSFLASFAAVSLELASGADAERFAVSALRDVALAAVGVGDWSEIHLVDSCECGFGIHFRM